MSRNVAAIDCGTNSTRVLVAAPDGAPLERLMRITRLGEGVDRSSRLAPAAIERTIAALRDYRVVLDQHGVQADRIRMTATSAARDAANRDGFFDAAEAAIGVRPELLSGEEEGRLSFLGATHELDDTEGLLLVLDIGGGSTEFVVGERGDPSPGVVSTDMGCVRVTEKFLRSDPPDAGELSDALTVVRQHLDDVVRELPRIREVERLVGLAGTITTMAAVELGVPHDDLDSVHHFVLTKAAAEDVFRTLATEPLRDRIHNPGLERDRAEVIVGGALILVAVLRYFDIDECLVSVSDILDGLARSVLQRDGAVVRTHDAT
jgi:exopolyphosphatase/guanosine-5'-triphosphate,3'-diphosphate pyrophosphatase